ncbi:hypothetical protein HOO65_040200 [Ceratocystis lukuohia]|uniref:F-box domain-containing protein n=1 Tax=Ceratocystis lukuohia TaxID=2019550 RepID=A0ABR4MHV9_9PEZI
MTCMSAKPIPRSKKKPRLNQANSRRFTTLLDLPSEIIFLIIEYLLLPSFYRREPTVTIYPNCTCLDICSRLHTNHQGCHISRLLTNDMAILRTSRALYHHARAVLYGSTEFHIPLTIIDSLGFKNDTALGVIARHGAAYVRSVKLSMTTPNFFRRGWLVARICKLREMLPAVDTITLECVMENNPSYYLYSHGLHEHADWDQYVLNDPVLHRVCGRKLIIMYLDNNYCAAKVEFDMTLSLDTIGLGSLRYQEQLLELRKREAIMFKVARRLLDVSGKTKYIKCHPTEVDGEPPFANDWAPQVE